MKPDFGTRSCRKITGYPSIACLLSFCLIIPHAYAQIDPQSRADAPIIKYRTREEKREAGLTTELTSWLRFQGEAESEFLRESVGFREGGPDHNSDFVDPSMQFNFEVFFGEDFETELIFQYSEDSEDPIMEELIMGWDIGEWGGDWGVSVGRYYVPFGEYFSNFINGPLIEFSQTRGDAIQVDFDYEDRFEIAAFLFDSYSEKSTGSNLLDNWGVSFEAKAFGDHVVLGGGWLSNIADGDFRPLEDELDIYEQSVPAWNLYIIAEWDTLGLSFETVKATRSFLELDEEENSPSAWNIEAAWYPSMSTELAIRFERAREIPEEPEKVSGIEFTWRPANRVSLTVEYLWLEYRKDFVFDDNDREFGNGSLIAASFAYIF